GEDRVREEGDGRGELKRVEEDDHPRLHQVTVLRVLKLSVDLCQRLLARHGEERVAEGHQYADESEQSTGVRREAVARLWRGGFGRGGRPGGVFGGRLAQGGGQETGQPPECATVEPKVVGPGRARQPGR